jgi:sortase B
MSKKENNNKMLSFDKLRSGLGIEGELTDIESEVTAEENSTQTEKNVKIEGKSIVENGKTFIDITDQFTFYEAEPKKDPIIVPPTVENLVTPVVTKKRIKTFKEIFADFVKFFVPVKADSGKEKIQKVAMDISIILIVCCIIGIVGVFVEHKQNSIDASSQIATVDKLQDNEYAEAWKDAYAQSSGTGFPTGMNSKYAYLYYINQDLVGWLKINNTNLDVQIVQGDDNEYYSSRDFYKNSNQYGCPYMDYKNRTQGLDDNTIIYGPYMSNNLMFASLEQYKTVDGYKKSPLIEFSTLYETYTFKVFAALISTSSPAEDGGFSYTGTDFISDAKFSEFINKVKSKSIINTDVSVQTDDKIITLVTSSNEFEGARFVVMGRLVRENESVEVDVNSATLNTSPEYPQAWYDNKSNNPFAE